MPPSKYLHNQHSPTSISVLDYIQVSVYIERLVCLDLHFAYPIAWCDALLNWRLELVAPWTSPAVTIAVVVAAQKVALSLRASFDSERNIN